MLPIIIAMVAITTVIVLWTVFTQRKLAVLDENAISAMIQIGVQLSGRFDALEALLDLANSYTRQGSESMIEPIKTRRIIITAKSAPEDVLFQESIISESMVQIAEVAELFPELKANQKYQKALDAMEVYENMERTSHLIYNDSVSKLNREIRIFPAVMLSRMIGFRQREYLVQPVLKVDMLRIE